jgi:hypothetical protein
MVEPNPDFASRAASTGAPPRLPYPRDRGRGAGPWIRAKAQPVTAPETFTFLATVDQAPTFVRQIAAIQRDPAAGDGVLITQGMAQLVAAV